MTIVVDGAWCGGTLVGPTEFEIEPGVPLRGRPARSRIGPSRLTRSGASGWFALPGFVDAHVHLELSDLPGEQLRRESFAAWVEDLVRARRARPKEAIAEAIRSGVRQLLASGTVAVGDIDPFGGAFDVLASTPLEGVVYRELLGRPVDGLEARLEQEIEACARTAPIGRQLRLGLSPHAPYSTDQQLFRLLADLSRRLRVPIASHVAESGDEDELLVRGGGPLAALFDRWGVAPVRWEAPRAGSFQRVESVAPPPGFVVIHGNRLTGREIEVCGRRGWPLVYCPRSHRYFDHPRYPAAAVLAAGGTLALGTDSRASNVGLDLWAEMATFRTVDGEVPDAAILAAATAAGRRVLWLTAAELCTGDAATLQLVRTRDGAPLEPQHLVAAAVRGALVTRAVFIDGRLAWGDPLELPAA